MARADGRGDADDPLLRQVLPSVAERAEVGGFGDDPTGDAAASVGAGVLHNTATACC